MPPALIRAFFPSPAREFRWQRWVNIGLRSAHLVGVAGIGGGFLFTQDRAAWEAYWQLTVVTGVALSVLYLWSTATWMCELKGLAIVVKTALLATALTVPAIRGELFVLVVVISGLIAHAPGRVRGYRWIKPPEASEHRS